MLQDLHIKGFKGLRDLQLTDISRVMLVGGKNDIGKTSLLESIFLFYDTADLGMFFRHLEWRGIDLSFTDAEGLFSPLFTDFRMDNPISFEVKNGIYTVKMNIRFNPSLVQKAVNVDISRLGDTTDTLQTDDVTATSYSMNIHYEVSSGSQEDVTIVLRQTPTNIDIQFEPHPVSIIPLEMPHNVIFFPSHIRKVSNEDAIRFSELDVKKQIGLIVDFLRLIDPQLISLTLVMLRKKYTVYADVQGTDRKVPVALLGEGMNRLLSIILAIATANNGIILVDEIDAGFHYSVLPKVWEGLFRAARDFNCQIIATTHSYECLRAAYDGAAEAQAEEDFSYIRLESSKGNIITKRFSHAVLGAALGHGWEVR